jgi:hypothetical protein
MWLAFVLGAITCGGTVFMIRFLIALIREGAPSVNYWVIPSVARSREGSEQGDSEKDFDSDSWNRASARTTGAPGARSVVRLGDRRRSA